MAGILPLQHPSSSAEGLWHAVLGGIKENWKSGTNICMCDGEVDDNEAL